MYIGKGDYHSYWLRDHACQPLLNTLDTKLQYYTSIALLLWSLETRLASAILRAEPYIRVGCIF